MAASGPGVSPATALAVGLKVDVDALPRSLQRAIARGKVDLDDPAVTLELLKLDAVVGVTGFFDEQGRITSMGIQCALCHSTVDDSFAHRHRASARRLGQSRSQCRRHHCARAAARGASPRC